MCFHVLLKNIKHFFSLSLKNRSFLTQPFLFEEYRVLIPVGESFSTYDKLISPFDLQTWLLIIFTFLSAFFVIFAVNLTNSDVRNFVFGKNVTSPTLNIAMLFFGLSQVKVPRRNFSRYLVIVFILYSMIIRTCYQSKMFEHMQMVRKCL